jgi:Na+-translocating ferredoxin:NAD+ oxidoreductase RNF subunit RnfB
MDVQNNERCNLCASLNDVRFLLTLTSDFKAVCYICVNTCVTRIASFVSYCFKIEKCILFGTWWVEYRRTVGRLSKNGG